MVGAVELWGTGENSVLLNVFWYIYWRMGDFQSRDRKSPKTVAHIFQVISCTIAHEELCASRPLD